MMIRESFRNMKFIVRGESGETSTRSFFLYSPFPEISPQCNTPNGNQRDEPLALVYFSYRTPLEEKHLGKISGHLGAGKFPAPLRVLLVIVIFRFPSKIRYL